MVVKSLYPAKCYYCEYPAYDAKPVKDGVIMLCKSHDANGKKGAWNE